jgi:hypothetical protein
LRIKAGDTAEDLVIPLTENGIPLNITAATSVTVRGARRGGLVPIINDTNPTRDNANGVVTHVWQALEVAVPGRLWVDVIVTWPTKGPQTFPPLGYLAVDIEDAI